MDGKRAGGQRAITRACEPNRLEEELWAAAYEALCPLVRRVVKQQEPAMQHEPLERLVAAGEIARRA